jgi:hypothetical protein
MCRLKSSVQFAASLIVVRASVLTLETTSLDSLPNKHATGTDRNAFENHGHTPQQMDREGMSLRDTGEIAHCRSLWFCTDSQIPLLHI